MSKTKIFISLTAVVSCLVLALPWFSLTNDQSLYWLPLKRPQTRPDVVILAIDNASINEFGRWPWSRDTWAKISERLSSAKPAGTALDINFTETSDPVTDGLFSKSIGKLGPTVLSAQGVFFANQNRSDPTNWILPIEVLTQNPNVKLGHPHIIDNKSYLTPKTLTSGNKPILPLANALLDIPDTSKKEFVNFYGQAGTIPTIPIKEVISDPGVLAELKDKWIFIGATASDLRDTVMTPAGLMAGVEWHATIAGNLLDQNTRKAVPYWVSILITLVVTGVAIWGRKKNSKFWSFFVFYGSGAVLFILFSFLLWTLGFALPPLSPVITILLAGTADGVATWLLTEQQKRQLQRTVQSYFSPAVLSHLIKHPSHLELGGVKKDVTILFSDIRSFTTISEATEPQLLSQMLQEYFTCQTEEILKTDGVVDKFIGDAIMAFWGAPLLQADHADRAIKSALGMLHALPGLNKKFVGLGWPEIKIGIGLNSGSAVVGNLGSKQRFDYTVIGDPVNLASRLESACKEQGVPLVISGFTKAQAKDSYDWIPLGNITVKGKTVPVDIYTIKL